MPTKQEFFARALKYAQSHANHTNTYAERVSAIQHGWENGYKAARADFRQILMVTPVNVIWSAISRWLKPIR